MSSALDNFPSKYMEFHVHEKKPKTYVWRIHAKKTNEVLGWIKWFPHWRQYIFQPEEGTIYNHSCLEEITRFLIRQNKIQREKKE